MHTLLHRPGATQRAVVLVLTAFLTWLGRPARCLADEDQPRPSDLVPLFPSLEQNLKDLPPFLRDTDLRLDLRIYYLKRVNPDAVENEALTFGGWLSYRSGWLLETLQVGATFYASLPLYAPEDRDGTLLLQTGQKGYGALGEAFVSVRYEDYARLQIYRQQVEQGYINRSDIRMTPYTFEGITLSGELGPVAYLAGYLSRIKPRNAVEFQFMSEQAGAPGSHYGVALLGVKLEPLAAWKLEVSEQYGVNTYNTVFARTDYTHSLAPDLVLLFGGQLTDQRAVGDKLLTNAAAQDWSTLNLGAKAGATYEQLTLSVRASVTGEGNSIQAPWGNSPSYAGLIQETFERAKEKAVAVGAGYETTLGLSTFADIAWGWGAVDPQSDAAAPDQTEYDLTIDYRPPAGFLLFPTTRDLWFRLRGVILDSQDAERLGWQVRLIVNWELPLIYPPSVASQ